MGAPCRLALALSTPPGAPLWRPLRRRIPRSRHKPPAHPGRPGVLPAGEKAHEWIAAQLLDKRLKVTAVGVDLEDLLHQLDAGRGPELG